MWENTIDSIIKGVRDTFGDSQPAQFKPKGSTQTYPIKVVYDESYLSVDLQTGAAVQSSSPKCFARLADFPTQQIKNGEITIRGTLYNIVEVQKDGQGGVDLILQKKVLNGC